MNKPVLTSFAHQRVNPRIPVSLDVDWGETRDCLEAGRITSLSIAGCFIEAALGLAVGQQLFIRLLLAPSSEGGNEGMVLGEVIYQLPKLGLGVKFKKLPAGYGKHIEDLVEFYLSSHENE